MFKYINGNFNYKHFSIPLIVYTLYSFKNNKMRCENNMTRVLLNNLNLNEGEMKEIKVGKTDKESILVVKYNNSYHALSNYCPHFGAPMSTGIVIDNIIKCPWHGASFDILTGECDIGPSIDGLNKYKIIEDNGELFALVDMTTLQKGKKPEFSKRDTSNETHFVILGGGPASLSAAETLRSTGFTVYIYKKGKN